MDNYNKSIISGANMNSNLNDTVSSIISSNDVEQANITIQELG